MERKHIEQLLENVAAGKLKVKDAVSKLETLPFEDIGFASIDNHRNIRSGYPEVIFCQGKTCEQVAEIMLKLSKDNNNVMGTRADKQQYEAVKEVLPDAVYFKEARIILFSRNPRIKEKGYIAVVSAGTADIPVAEEAALTAEILGNTVERVYDVGVAGIHRLFAKLDLIRSANVVIVVAGMEGALASVVGGMVDRPVVAVPTSIGYGSNLGGLSALLSMLNSCANGVGVVNIDNGFGAGYLAAIINRQK
ncbi:nickel pincer cofactor biosynthesis protein LarB [Aminipila luticellarii]|uniref:Nickel pincer cofactor biosynthesis protein LarB n=1 Tax=Aminipila luticellarii TaxID=2507160 RepID=A0A410PS52_9FIRM|nr:nickel pincer cofactor biosynthesis protein LarB [Aminipila luticellarii]QAT41750.1 nickel pincer cofactor biosynthesis protein LarB [Aminipila luticellarii]